MVSQPTLRGVTALLSLFFVSTTTALPTPTDAPDIPATKTADYSDTIPTTAPKHWKHPGVFVSGLQMRFVADKVASNAQPWTGAFSSMLADPLAATTRTAKPYATVECGPTSTPNVGCYDERDDSMAAYMNALAWWVTKSVVYAEQAVMYMNAWASTIRAHTNSNAPLQTGWSGANWVRAGELMLWGHDHGVWEHEDIETFKGMLRNVYVPEVINGSATQNGNWELVMMEAAIGAAVFLEDKAIYETAMSIFAARVPAYIYLLSDGPYPIPGHGIKNTTAAIVKYWNGQQTYPVDGITQETCRDFAHTSYGISSISHVAETARIQGNDLWETSLGTRIKAALELHSPFQTGEPIPLWLCNGTIPRSFDPVVEPPYNALAFRLKQAMPNTEKLVQQQRPAAIGEAQPLFIGWETLTNAENPY